MIMIRSERSDALGRLRIVAVGGGPAGLLLAIAACANGAEVIVLEQAGDPRGIDPGYTNRSFNITLNDVGRAVLGNPRAWEGGATILGRAIHGPDTGVRYSRYGERPSRNCST